MPPVNLNRFSYFIAVVETGSFTAASERLNVTKAVVSQQVSKLEQEVRTTLLVRNTRSVKPTPAGQAFYHRCSLILRETEDALGELAKTSDVPAGVLRLTAPFDYGIRVLVPVIGKFIERFPQCRVDARFSDQTLKLNTGELDLAIRAGWLTEENVTARRIGTFGQQMVAGPQWRTRLSTVTEPEGLAMLPIVAHAALREPTRWTFRHRDDPSHTQVVSMRAPATFDATLAVHEATLAGAGLAVLPEFLAAADVAAGRLIKVLPEWGLPSGDINAVFPAGRYRTAKVRAFVDLLVECLQRAG